MTIYTPNTWTDNVTPVDKAHMDRIENGLVASQYRDEKGVANGYAGLDASGKLAVAAMPISYGTTLPASPADGQLAILVDSVTNPTWWWQFRYNAGSTSSYKWEYVGGSKRVGYDSPSNAANTGAWTSYLPNLQVARAGEYYVQQFISIFTPSGVATQLYHAPIISTESSPGEVYGLLGVAGGAQIGLVSHERLCTVAALALFGCALYSSAAGVTCTERRLYVWPKRVS